MGGAEDGTAGSGRNEDEDGDDGEGAVEGRVEDDEYFDTVCMLLLL